MARTPRPSRNLRVVNQPRAEQTTVFRDSRRGRFVRLANKRLLDCKEGMDKVKNMANRQHYEYTPEEVAQMRKLLLGWVESTLAAFENLEPPTDELLRFEE